MCYFGELDQSGLLGYLVQIVFLVAGCTVSYVGLVLSIFLFGFSPAYVYGYFVYRKKSRITTWPGKLHAFVAATMTLLLSGILWMSAMVIGMWG